MNDYFNPPAGLIPAQTARSEDINDRMASIAAGFDKLPARLKLLQNRLGYCVDTGAAGAMVVALDVAPTAYVDGMELLIKVAATNTTAATINVNGLGAIPLLRYNGDLTEAGDLQAGELVKVAYLSTSFRLLNSTERLTESYADQATAGAATATAQAAIATDAATAAAGSAASAGASATSASNSAAAAAASVLAVQQFALIGSVAAAGAASVEWSGITLSHLVAVIEGASKASTDQLVCDVSLNNGASYTAGFITVSPTITGGSPWSGSLALLLTGKVAFIISGNSSLGIGTASKANGVRLRWSGGGNFTAGTIHLFGR